MASDDPVTVNLSTGWDLSLARYKARYNVWECLVFQDFISLDCELTLFPNLDSIYQYIQYIKDEEKLVQEAPEIVRGVPASQRTLEDVQQFGP